MRFAVAILVIVALAACIGSIVPQNAGPAAYVSQYGTTWTAVLVFLGMTDVYHASWLRRAAGGHVHVDGDLRGAQYARHAPAGLRSAGSGEPQVRRDPALPLKKKTLPSATQEGEAALLATLMPALRRERFVSPHGGLGLDGALLVAARRGGARRVGYILTHAAIVLITVAAFLDSDLAVRGRVLAGLQQIETRDPARSMPCAQQRAAGRHAQLSRPAHPRRR